jgi:hypothetical protein
LAVDPSSYKGHHASLCMLFQTLSNYNVFLESSQDQL